MKHEPIFTWEEETGMASCILTDGQKTYTGFAQCHPDDKDMSCEKTGCEIALRRARINTLRGYRDELKTQLKTLKQLYYTMNKSTKFNEKSYENRMLQRMTRQIKFDLDTTNEMIIAEQQNLRDYIKNKDTFYQRIRSNRKKANII